MSDEQNFLGLEIKGVIVRYSEGAKEQHDPVIFLNALIEVFNVPGVLAVRWEQYTPYFNDGEPCIFHAGDPYIKLQGVDKEAGSYEDGYLTSWELTSDWHKNHVGGYEGDLQLASDKLNDFASILCNGHFNAVLNQKFGDPAQVIAYRNEQGQLEFSVEFYEHD